MIKSGINIDHFYYNIIIKHDDINYGFRSSPATYLVELTNAIIDRPSDYYVSIVRFSVDAQTIPINIFREDLKVTLYYNNTDAYQRPVIFIPTHAGAQPE